MPTATQTVTETMAGGAREAGGIVADTMTRGPSAVARDELGREREYVRGAASTARTLVRAGQSGSQLVAVMLTITIAAAIGFVGTAVISEIDDSVSTTGNFADAENNISQGFTDAMGLTDIVFLVLMFSVILGALLAFRNRR